MHRPGAGAKTVNGPGKRLGVIAQCQLRPRFPARSYNQSHREVVRVDIAGDSSVLLENPVDAPVLSPDGVGGGESGLLLVSIVGLDDQARQVTSLGPICLFRAEFRYRVNRAGRVLVSAWRPFYLTPKWGQFILDAEDH